MAWYLSTCTATFNEAKIWQFTRRTWKIYLLKSQPFPNERLLLFFPFNTWSKSHKQNDQILSRKHKIGNQNTTFFNIVLYHSYNTIQNLFSCLFRQLLLFYFYTFILYLVDIRFYINQHNPLKMIVFDGCSLKTQFLKPFNNFQNQNNNDSGK